MKKKVIYAGFSVTLSLAMALSYSNIKSVKAEANENVTQADAKESTLYFKAKLFDYDAVQRDEYGNWIVEDSTYSNDDDLFMFGQAAAYTPNVPKPGEQNTWDAVYKNKIVSGLLESRLDDNGNIVLSNGRKAVSGGNIISLFDTDSEDYKGTYDFPLTSSGDGWYQYDSSKSHIQISGETDEDGDGILVDTGYASDKGFMPFNELDMKKYHKETDKYSLKGDADFYFGMELDVPFYKTSNGKIVTEGNDAEDIVFNFTGDDDVWVFIDDELVLDLGGVHDAVSGSIDFAKATVTTTGNHYNEDKSNFVKAVEEVEEDSDYLASLTKGRHSMKIFYLERGAEVSNCKMSLRLVDSETNEEVTKNPTEEPTEEVTENPTEEPTKEVTENPTEEPTKDVTENPTEEPTKDVTNEPTQKATDSPSYVVIDDDDVPLAPGVDDVTPTKKPSSDNNKKVVKKDDKAKATAVATEKADTEDMVSIEDEEVPLASGEDTLPQTGTAEPGTFAVFGGVLMLMGALGLIFRKKLN